jgi:hypothetical protein
MMPENRKVVEAHGCIVCGKSYNMFVVYSPNGKMLDCMVTDMGAHRVPDPNRPLVACNTHSEDAIERALEKHYPGRSEEDEEED